MITRREVEILKAIIEYIDENGEGPSVKDIGDTVELKSKGTVHGYLDSLERIGCINRATSRTRDLVVTNEGKEWMKMHLLIQRTIKL